MNNERQFYTSQLSDTQYLQLIKAFELIYDSEIVLRGAQYLMGQTYPSAVNNLYNIIYPLTTSFIRGEKPITLEILESIISAIDRISDYIYYHHPNSVIRILNQLLYAKRLIYNTISELFEVD